MYTTLKTRLWRLAFLTAAGFAVVMAVMPQPPELPGGLSDKLLHMLAFAVLALLAKMAYPRAQAWKILLGLGIMGAAIEVAQAAPALGRNASLTDWIADMLAICAALGVMTTLPWLMDTIKQKTLSKRAEQSVASD
jgi:VanZ family protein